MDNTVLFYKVFKNRKYMAHLNKYINFNDQWSLACSSKKVLEFCDKYWFEPYHSLIVGRQFTVTDGTQKSVVFPLIDDTIIYYLPYLTHLTSIKILPEKIVVTCLDQELFVSWWFYVAQNIEELEFSFGEREPVPDHKRKLMARLYGDEYFNSEILFREMISVFLQNAYNRLPSSKSFNRLTLSISDVVQLTNWPQEIDGFVRRSRAFCLQSELCYGPVVLNLGKCDNVEELKISDVYLTDIHLLSWRSVRRIALSVLPNLPTGGVRQEVPTFPCLEELVYCTLMSMVEDDSGAVPVSRLHDYIWNLIHAPELQVLNVPIESLYNRDWPKLLCGAFPKLYRLTINLRRFGPYSCPKNDMSGLRPFSCLLPEDALLRDEIYHSIKTIKLMNLNVYSREFYAVEKLTFINLSNLEIVCESMGQKFKEFVKLWTTFTKLVEKCPCLRSIKAELPDLKFLRSLDEADIKSLSQSLTADRTPGLSLSIAFQSDFYKLTSEMKNFEHMLDKQLPCPPDNADDDTECLWHATVTVAIKQKLQFKVRYDATLVTEV